MDKSLIKDALKPFSYVDQQGNIKTLDPQKMLTFDDDNLPFNKTANTYYLVARLAERKRLESKDLASQLDALRGSLYIQYIQDKNFKAINGGRKPPENMLNTAIESDAKYIKLSQAVNVADYQYRCLNWLVKALEMKANMMQSVSANKRKEIDVQSHTGGTGI